MTAIFSILVGLLALVAGGELLIRGARSLAQLARVPPKLVGLTVVAVGTSLPELSVSLRAAADGAAEVAVGNALGSNLFNIAVVLGLSALVCPLTTGRSETRRDWPWMMATLLLCWALASDGQLSRLDGALLTSVFLAFVVSLVVQAKRSPVPPHEGPPASLRAALIALGLLVAGIPLLAVGAGWFVAGATAVARTFDVSEAVIGLTIVAAAPAFPSSSRASWPRRAATPISRSPTCSAPTSSTSPASSAQARSWHRYPSRWGACTATSPATSCWAWRCCQSSSRVGGSADWRRGAPAGLWRLCLRAAHLRGVAACLQARPASTALWTSASPSLACPHALARRVLSEEAGRA